MLGVVPANPLPPGVQSGSKCSRADMHTLRTAGDGDMEADDVPVPSTATIQPAPSGLEDDDSVQNQILGSQCRFC